MPALIVSSRYTTDSQVLRQTAQRLGWETLRLDAGRIPDWFEPPDEQIALFYTAPHAFDIAAQLSRVLLGCNPEWTIALGQDFLHREIRQMTLEAALRLSGKWFAKHAVSKAFPAAIYDAESLAEATAKLSRTSLIHVADPVEWSVEYRCFVTHRDVAAISPYRRHAQIIEDHSDQLGAPPAEIEGARQYCLSVVQSPSVECPPAFVLDVGIIENRGWAVVEFNECWASGIYACDPEKVLATLLRSCVRLDSITEEVRRWDFRKHYFRACPV